MIMTTNHQSETSLIADDLALDFINTEHGVGDKHSDCFIDDQSVMDWLKAVGLVPRALGVTPKGLVALARALRVNTQVVMRAALEARPADATVINRVLESGRPVKKLGWDRASGSFKVTKRRRDDHAASLLEPVAEAITNLLAGEQFKFVRQCEAHDCTLFFLDRTKSHRRRWCSMATCGNRMKVAAFRSRQNENKG